MRCECSARLRSFFSRLSAFLRRRVASERPLSDEDEEEEEVLLELLRLSEKKLVFALLLLEERRFFHVCWEFDHFSPLWCLRGASAAVVPGVKQVVQMPVASE